MAWAVVYQMLWILILTKWPPQHPKWELYHVEPIKPVTVWLIGSFISKCTFYAFNLTMLSRILERHATHPHKRCVRCETLLALNTPQNSGRAFYPLREPLNKLIPVTMSKPSEIRACSQAKEKVHYFIKDSVLDQIFFFLLR